MDKTLKTMVFVVSILVFGVEKMRLILDHFFSIGRNMERFKAESKKILAGNAKVGGVPTLWDGKAGKRIAEIIATTDF
jgi:hypothetical protein